MRTRSTASRGASSSSTSSPTPRSPPAWWAHRRSTAEAEVDDGATVGATVGATGDRTGLLTDYYPVSLNVAGRACLVVGGGPVATRKARGLAQCGAAVTVVAPELCDAMVELAQAFPLTLERRPYAPGEAAGYRLVVTATGIAHVDAAVHADAEAANVWVNSADDHDHCTFILPAVHRDGAVTLAVSTGGSSPALASWLRARLAALAGPGVGDLAALLAEARQQLRTAGHSTESVDWATLLNGPLPALVQEGRLEEARALVASAVGVTLQQPG